MKLGACAFLYLWLLGCNQSVETRSYPAHRETPTTREPQSCPLEFNGVCASLEWSETVSPDIDLTFTLRTWHCEGAQSQPYEDPGVVVSGVLKMSCCGSLFPLQVEKIAVGIYRFSKVHFYSGEWDLMIRMKNGGEQYEKTIHYRFD